MSPAREGRTAKGDILGCDHYPTALPCGWPALA